MTVLKSSDLIPEKHESLPISYSPAVWIKYLSSTRPLGATGAVRGVSVRAQDSEIQYFSLYVIQLWEFLYFLHVKHSLSQKFEKSFLIKTRLIFSKNLNLSGFIPLVSHRNFSLHLIKVKLT